MCHFIDVCSRFVHGNRSQRAKSSHLLGKLEKISVFEVDAIEVIVGLGSVVKKTTEKVLIEEEHDRLSILIWRNCPPDERMALVCSQLAKLLAIDEASLYFLGMLPPQMVERYLNGRGFVSMSEDQLSRDRSWIESDPCSVPHEFQSRETAGVFTDSHQSPVSDSGLDAGIFMVRNATSRGSLNDWNVMMTVGPRPAAISAIVTLEDNDSRMSTPSPAFSQPPSAPSLDEHGAEYLAGSSYTQDTNNAAPNVPFLEIPSHSFQSNITPEQVLNGFLGELYVSHSSRFEVRKWNSFDSGIRNAHEGIG